MYKQISKESLIFPCVIMIFLIVCLIGGAGKSYAQTTGIQKIIAYDISDARFIEEATGKVEITLVSKDTSVGFGSGHISLTTQVFPDNAGEIQTESLCGDGYCDWDENSTLCLVDCPITPFCGEFNGDGFLDRNDMLFLENFMFQGGSPPAGWPSDITYSDLDGNGQIDIADLVFFIDFLNGEGPAPHCGLEE